jgi:biopolymer transport protein ExbD
VVDRAGNIAFNAQPLTLAAFKQTIFQLKAEEPDPSVVVLGAGEADYEKVIGVLDVLQQAEIGKVGLATETAP